MKTFLALLLSLPFLTIAQTNYDTQINEVLSKTLKQHRELVSIPNLPADPDLMLKNISWVQEKYKALGFKTSLLESSTLTILLAEKVYDPEYKTVLFYVHIDGQPINPMTWNQEDPFTPVLKEQDAAGNWQAIDWSKLDGNINDEWRIFGRAAADDKAPITIFLTALEVLQQQNKTPKFNVKIIFDPEEEYGSSALLSTLATYKARYAADYFVVMDGPAHDSNKPTLTFGCRGIATCAITTYGARLPQHSGHYGNYAPNPVFRLTHLLSSMKDEDGRVLVDGFYEGIKITPEAAEVLSSVPYSKAQFNAALGIHSAEKVGDTYQKALQFPSLNIRQIGTSWTGEGLKTVVPEYAVANIDVRLVPETDGDSQLEKIKKHIKDEGYYVIDRDPTEEERLTYAKIAKFTGKTSVNAFRTPTDSEFGKNIRGRLVEAFGENPVTIRIMGGTVPIVPLINTLDIPTVILPMVNMDNNQHNPNENIRVGNIRQGIKICLALLETEF
ncbi:M20/M25/M40 family metallo-hydrolase [Dokdonia sinensis]|uniref:M20/M25/M40 family metallo-hydrolase n=1 Tax=Dokdonia sinensis TaxID=2479847 RepID=A0A3M0H1D0_9FLAO|nr:M20/M25/M40 family metallo-hydrolase [Dokdonia sinensis]RMB63416.1 M20/M25/M40 family metallo-hydrolase [Dokdonia sinensis]